MFPQAFFPGSFFPAGYFPKTGAAGPTSGPPEGIFRMAPRGVTFRLPERMAVFQVPPRPTVWTPRERN